MNYFTSDFHFGESDERLKLYGRDRLRLTAHEIDELMITRYNLVVKDGDRVYIVGDFCKTPEHLQTASRLKGYKILIKGNYDEQFSDEELLKHFQEVHTDLTIDLQDGTKVFINHYPVKGSNKLMNLCGHIHNLWQVQRNMINLSVDAWIFAPISEDEICFKINAIKKYYDQNVFPGELDINTGFKQVDKKIIIPSDTIDESDKLVFLAGPIRGSENWRKQFIYSLNKIDKDFVVANPQWKTDNFNLPNQIEWEHKSMQQAFTNGCLVFWLAKQETEVKQSFGRTTRFEIGEYIEKFDNSNGNLVIGIDESFEGREYIEYKASQVGLKICRNFEELIEEIKYRL